MRAKYPESDPFASASFEALRRFILESRQEPSGSFEDYERELHRRVQAWEAEVVGAQLAGYDIDEPRIEFEGQVLRNKMKSVKEYHCLAGTFEVERTLYVPASGGGKATCPLEFRAGIVEGCWSPLAARVMAQAVAISTPKEASSLFRELGGMQPSTSSLDRLPKGLSEKWEARRQAFESDLREEEEIPAEAVAVAVSLDGVQVPMKDGERAKKRSQPDKRPKGPAGYREVGCGTITFYDLEGEALQTIRYGRMPQAKKTTLKSQLTAELQSIFASEPGLELVGISDGAPDHWEFLEELTGEIGVEGLEMRKAVDLFHVLERVKRALDAYHEESTPESKAAFEECRVWLRESTDGAKRVLRALRYRRGKSRGSTRAAIDREIRYIEKRTPLMGYKDLLDEHLPVGSGVVEAACKTLASERLKRSGMSWRETGLQSILTLRSLIQSDRWSRAWQLLAREYKSDVSAA
ncbi:MAG: hypothetical protein ACE5EF_14440 [Dehalococcoidia bacterium]